jgi:hypothetical protein
MVVAAVLLLLKQIVTLIPWLTIVTRVASERSAVKMAEVEDMEGRDIKDSALKAWDKLTGGDGTADGEKLTDNMKRETSASPSINSGTKR